MNLPELAPECAWAQSELAEARTSSATPETAARLQAHLASCAACRQWQAWEERLAEGIAHDPLPPLPSSLETRVRTLLRQRRQQRALVGGIAAALLIGTAALALWSYSVKPAPGPGPIVRPAQPLPDDDLAFIFELPVVDMSSEGKAWRTVLTKAGEGGRK